MKLGVFEILNVAETIERDGIDFYRKAARLFDDEQLRKMLLLLAEWERKHEGVFSAMKKELMQIHEKSMTFDVSSYLSSSPLALKSLAWSATQSKSKREFTGREDKEEILELAMSRERSTIRFYFDVMGVLGDSVGKTKINEIIEEEKRHVSILRRALDQLRDPQSACSP
jgi:rubrerythrin